MATTTAGPDATSVGVVRLDDGHAGLETSAFDDALRGRASTAMRRRQRHRRVDDSVTDDRHHRHRRLGGTDESGPSPTPAMIRVAGVDDVGADSGGEIDVAVLDEIERELADVELALERLGDGTYGRCESCGQVLRRGSSRASRPAGSAGPTSRSSCPRADPPGGSGLLGLPEDLVDLGDLVQQVLGHRHVGGLLGLARLLGGLPEDVRGPGTWPGARA